MFLPQSEVREQRIHKTRQTRTYQASPTQTIYNSFWLFIERVCGVLHVRTCRVEMYEIGIQHFPRQYIFIHGESILNASGRRYFFGP